MHYRGHAEPGISNSHEAFGRHGARGFKKKGFLAKPFRDQDLPDAVASAVQRDRERRDQEHVISGLRAHFESLTPREREIMTLVASGLMSKQIAAKFEISEITVKVHRSHLMKKMGARTVAALVRMAEALDMGPAPSSVETKRRA